jgi:cyanobactin maturation PatA/PatG family protease
MADHLAAHASEARALIWTLNLELTPIYAVEPVGPYAAEVYGLLAQLLAGAVAGAAAPEFIELVSVPGRRTDRQVRLFSGQTVPVVEVEEVRGLYGWAVNRLVDEVLEVVRAAAPTGRSDDAGVRMALREFLTRVYYDLRNLGATAADRALNFAATNAFQVTETLAGQLAAGLALESIGVARSPFCRLDSDCWDVKLRFFDPENDHRARQVCRYTIDVSDVLPVTLGEVRSWSEAGRRSA